MKSLSLKAMTPIVAILLTYSSISTAAELFSDGFETGNKSYTENNIQWTSGANSSVSSEFPMNGTYSLRLNHTLTKGGVDSWAEQRVGLNKQFKEMWLKFNLYIPANYYHIQDNPNNNKFTSIWAEPYTSPTFDVNFSTIPNGSGGSHIVIKQFYDGREIPGINPQSGKNFIIDEDLGRWHQIVLHVKVPSGNNTNDGVMQLWKNGRNFIDLKNLNTWGGSKNYFDAFYLLGWANAGFREDTIFYIDDVVISDSIIGLNPPAAPDAQ